MHRIRDRGKHLSLFQELTHGVDVSCDGVPENFFAFSIHANTILEDATCALPVMARLHCYHSKRARSI